jgi:poly[(R)-3-hydroxyalkanoate] polymerase subunit PhaC
MSKTSATQRQADEPVRNSTPLLALEPPPARPLLPAVTTNAVSEFIESLLGDRSDPSAEMADVLDRTLNYARSRFTLGLSPAALSEAYFDWLLHLSSSPGKQMQLTEKAIRKWVRLSHFLATRTVPDEACKHCIEPLPHDKRFAAEEWRAWPYDVIYQSFLLQQQWWHNATTDVRGVTKPHERQVEFAGRQLLDIFSPANFIATNPEVLHKTMSEGGQNLVRGFWNAMDDWQRAVGGRPPAGAEAFKVGENIACTPGKVIFRNRLIELIQYTPTTDYVHPEPVFIVPAWIMKYYILDLSQQNSLVKHLRDHGFNVFIISWKNPTSDDRELGLEDYRQLGIDAAVAAIQEVVPDEKIHGVGYCLGGTLLAIAAAAHARNHHDPLKTLTMLAAQVDFTEPGELSLFVDESQVSFLEDMMWHEGYLDARQMSGAFQLLRSNDLIWSRMVRDYLMGERRPMIDLMAWNADSTRMPYRMHSQYLRNLFLNNDLAAGRYRVDGRPVALTDIRAPVFAVGTERDHVAPWHSVYKLHLLLDTDVTFVLTSGGHNAGIVSEPGVPRRHFRVRTSTELGLYADPETWVRETAERQGSWWPELCRWLQGHSGPMEVSSSSVTSNATLGDAPGSYVLQP